MPRSDFGDYGGISTELLSALETDTILTLGPVDWRDTTAAPALSALDIPVIWVPAPPGRAPAGPITSLNRLISFADVLARRTPLERAP